MSSGVVEDAPKPVDPENVLEYLASLRNDLDGQDSASKLQNQFSGLALAAASEKRGLNESELDGLAQSKGWIKLDASKINKSTAPMACYRRGTARLDFWTQSGTVASFLEHPKQAKTQLFRQDVTLEEADQLFTNPRKYYVIKNKLLKQQLENDDRTPEPTKNETNKRPCRFGILCHSLECEFDHSATTGDASALCPIADSTNNGTTTAVTIGGGRGPCRFGAKCNKKATCPFHHPQQPPPPPGAARGPCRYGAKCNNKKNCPFTHPNAPPPPIGSPRGPCRYGDKCHNPNCRFEHPKERSAK